MSTMKFNEIMHVKRLLETSHTVTGMWGVSERLNNLHSTDIEPSERLKGPLCLSLGVKLLGHEMCMSPKLDGKFQTVLHMLPLE